jgi:hypothetical protein
MKKSKKIKIGGFGLKLKRILTNTMAPEYRNNTIHYDYNDSHPQN